MNSGKSKICLANLITLSRIVLSLALLFLPTLSVAFGVLYLLGGISDMADGFVARKTHTESKTGAKLDSTADLVFVAVSAVKLLPHVRLDVRLWIWTIVIALIKITAMVLRFIRTHTFALPHSGANKLTGVLLFLLPLTLPLVDVRYTAPLICTVATFAAVQDILSFSMEKNIMLKTKRLTIHPASDAEMRDLIAHTDDDGLKAAYTEMLTMALENSQHRQWYAAWFIETPDGQRLGELCFKGLSADGTAEIGYGILPDFQNRGYATEAVKAVTDWALSQPNVNCITAETEPDNFASQKVLLKCGFVPTGEQGEEGPLFALTQR